MGSLRTVLLCFMGLSLLPGGIKSGKITKDDCSSWFLRSLLEAGYQIDNSVDLTLNLKYEDEEGVEKKAAIKLRDRCKEPKILCDGETNVINGELVTGPLLSCSWKWNEEDESTLNHVIVRLIKKKAIEVSGTISQNSEKVFPLASDKGPLDFKLVTPNRNGEEGKEAHRVKRADEDDTNTETPVEGDETTETTEETTTTEICSKAHSVFSVTNTLTYMLWTMWASFLVFALK